MEHTEQNNRYLQIRKRRYQRYSICDQPARLVLKFKDIITKQLLISIIIFTAPAVIAQESHEHNHEQSDNTDTHKFVFGQTGSAQAAIKTLEVIMTDNSYDLKSPNINSGDTVHFKFKNQGQQIHEFTIATNDMHAQHQKEMLKHISEGHMSMTDKGHGAGHDHDNSLLLNPGEQGELIWAFTDMLSNSSWPLA